MSEMEFFVEIVKGIQLLIAVAKSFVSNILHDSKYASTTQFSIWKYVLCNIDI